MKKELKTELEKIAYNCRKATYLIEKKQDEALTRRERMELKLHLEGCYICRVYENQSVLINAMMRQLFKTPAGVGPELDNDYKDLLKRTLDDKIKHR